MEVQNIVVVLTPLLLFLGLIVNLYALARQINREKVQKLDNKRADFIAQLVRREMPSDNRQRIFYYHGIDLKNTGKAPARDVHVDFVDFSLGSSHAKPRIIRSERVDVGQVVRLPHFKGKYRHYVERSHELRVKWRDETGENRQKSITISA